MGFIGFEVLPIRDGGGHCVRGKRDAANPISGNTERSKGNPAFSARMLVLEKIRSFSFFELEIYLIVNEYTISK